MEEKTEHFDTRDLAWTLWSLTQMGQDVNISQSFRLEEWKLRELNPSDASRLHCALATMLTSTEVQHRNVEVLDVVHADLELKLPSFSAQVKLKHCAQIRVESVGNH